MPINLKNHTKIELRIQLGEIEFQNFKHNFVYSEKKKLDLLFPIGVVLDHFIIEALDTAAHFLKLLFFTIK